MTYFDCVKEQCDLYAKKTSARFIGYNTVFGSRMYKTLSDVPADKCLEAPVAENLMVGLAVGMALEGYHPVLCFERHDFMLLALDGLVNHMDKLPWMSGDQFKLPIIVRAIVGSREPIDPGPMHSQAYGSAFRKMFQHTPVLTPITKREIVDAWDLVGKTPSGAVVIVEYKDMYKVEIPD